jgi:predicted enzyme related to lactoylglutathione lyase
MTAIRSTHVSGHADDLEQAATFYERLFGMKRIPTRCRSLTRPAS